MMDERKVWSALLSIKACDLRESLFIQCRDSVDKGIHIGGAESAIAPLTALYFGGTFRCNVMDPTTREQDIFVLSKGHAVAALASVYAEMGYFHKDKLKNSRGWGALITGHPTPVIPGVQMATGPLGQGISIACGYALRQRETGGFDTYCMVGDGELQEGSCWEGIMFAAEQKLRNLCVLVDKNNGQSDDTSRLLLSMEHVAERFEAFGFRVLKTDSGNMDSLADSLEQFKSYPRDSRPTAIICESFKGFGGYSVNTGKHKASFSDAETEAELSLLACTREQLVSDLNQYDRQSVELLAKKLNYRVELTGDGRIAKLLPEEIPVTVKRAAPRDKALSYARGKLPVMTKGKAYGATEVATGFARVFAMDDRFYTLDADLSNVSGLFQGTAMTNRYHGINVGIAECNMMCIAEGLAAQGANVWVSTFGPFFNWQAFRRIAVSYQEREVAIAEHDGWLSHGHNLDITFLSTASNLDTGVNGATHMSQDDICFFEQLAHVKIIDTSCPQQFQAVARWIAQGNKGLVYLRVLRYASPVLYEEDFEFTYGKGYYLRKAEHTGAVIISSGHGVLEAIAASELLEKEGIEVSVVDMPSYDGKLLREILKDGGALLFAEQNNGAWYDRFCRDFMEAPLPEGLGKVAHMNTRDAEDNLRFIGSGTYEQIIEALGLTAPCIAQKVKTLLS